MDFKSMAERLGLEEDEFIELAQLFVDTASSEIKRLEGALEASLVQGVVESSHSIKGSGGNLGFNEIFEAARYIEMQARQGSLEGASSRIETIRNNIEEIKQALS